MKNKSLWLLSGVALGSAVTALIINKRDCKKTTNTIDLLIWNFRFLREKIDKTDGTIKQVNNGLTELIKKVCESVAELDPNAPTTETLINAPAVYSREECIFNYCPRPELCKAHNYCVNNRRAQGFNEQDNTTSSKAHG